MKNRLITALVTVCCLALWVVAAAQPPRRNAEPRTVTFKTRTMGTVASLGLVTADSAAVADLAYRALLSLHHTDSLMTNWTETSETARINRLAGSATVTVDPEVGRVLAAAAEVGAASGGAFDITVEPLVRLWGFLGGTPAVPAPEAIAKAREAVGWRLVHFEPAAGTLRLANPAVHIDLGGVAKGFGVDRVVEILRQAGAPNALVDLSGNMFALGHAPGRDGWSLGIMDPDRRYDYLARVQLHDEAIATSGNYLQYVMSSVDGTERRYGHILDPRTGWPADGMASATVIAPDATHADAWATALIVLGAEEARRAAHEQPGIQAVLIEQSRDGRQVIWVEESLREKFMLREDLGDSVSIRYF